MKKISYIFHSGFVFEIESLVLIFDYWKDPAGIVAKIVAQDKPCYVFSSHFHEDHFSRDIFLWREGQRKNKITYVLSKDILRHRRAEKQEADLWLGTGASWQDERIRVEAMPSTDSGVSWVVQTEGLTIFHAGDLNNWYMSEQEEFKAEDLEKEEKAYLGALKTIGKRFTKFDIVFFPTDRRIGGEYRRGAVQFIKRFEVGLFVPMHFSTSGFGSLSQMADCCKETGVRFWKISSNGEEFFL